VCLLQRPYFHGSASWHRERAVLRQALLDMKAVIINLEMKRVGDVTDAQRTTNVVGVWRCARHLTHTFVHVVYHVLF
jgi:hypothetical protein